MEIKADEIYAFKLTSGQEIVAKVNEVTDEGYHLTTPLTLGQGEKGMEFIQVMFTGEHGADAFLHSVGVAIILPCREDVKEVYEQSINPSEIMVPSKQIITG